MNVGLCLGGVKGRTYAVNTTKEKPRRDGPNAPPRCRREHEAGLQAWARDQEAAGRVTTAHLQLVDTQT